MQAALISSLWDRLRPFGTAAAVEARPAPGSRAVRRDAGTIGLSFAITLLFAVLSIPVLVVILVVSYDRNLAATLRILHERMAATRTSSIEAADNLIRPVAGTLRIIAQAVAADPGVFRMEASRDLMHAALISADQLDALHVSFNDGYQREVARIDAGRPGAGTGAPPGARWLSSYVYEDAFSAGQQRRRLRTFFDTWPHAIGGDSEAGEVDIQPPAQDSRAKETRALAISEPSINADTGRPVMSLGYPVIRAGESLGVVGATVTLDRLSQFLRTHRVSANSVTLIADEAGRIIAHPTPEKSVRREGDKLAFATLTGSDDVGLRAALEARGDSGRSTFHFVEPTSGQRMVASIVPFPLKLQQPWQMITVTPLDDFVGPQKAINRMLVVLACFLIGLELVVIHHFARAVARGLASVSRQFEAVRGMDFSGASGGRSQLREIADLQEAFIRLRGTLRSFARYVPIDVVRELVRSGQPLALGVESRPMTVFFSDLENFSTYAEAMAPNDLLHQISTYFSVMTEAIAKEGGTVDKFTGDGVMAFWGAPVAQPDHARRACAAALRAARRMEALNREWARENRPQMRLRIGVNTATVLVGNIGSKERLNYTVLGDGVNVASRIEGLNKNFGTTICICESAFEAVRAEVVARPLQRVAVKGRQREILVYELLGFRNTDDHELAVSGDEVVVVAADAGGERRLLLVSENS
jgi:class 3 adenylate cyclase